MTESSILHVDMDAFFVAVEVSDDPSLAGRPVVVGGGPHRGVVAAASYEARAHGVHSAMPSARAHRLCPDAVFLPGRYDRYVEVSHHLFEVLESFTPLVEGLSLDEAFLDVAGARRRVGSPQRVAADLRAAVADRLGLSCSVGGSTVKFLAKMASEAAKPIPSPRGPIPGSGVHIVPPGGELAFLHPHPVSALWGVGPTTHARLRQLGVSTVGDLARLDLDVVTAAVGHAQGSHLHQLASGIDPRPVVVDRGVRSVGHEETFATDLTDPTVIATETVRLADAVAARLRRAGLAGRTVTVKIRHRDFSTVTRSSTFAVATDESHALAERAKDLVASVPIGSGIRLLGVSVSGLASTAAGQMTLDDLGPRRWRQTDEAVDGIRARFGSRAIGPASVTTGRGPRSERQAPWGPKPDEPGTPGP
ncbi:MAG TPA: DNA polymerase IV [Acidimicrobiales bacterium]